MFIERLEQSLAVIHALQRQLGQQVEVVHLEIILIRIAAGNKRIVRIAKERGSPVAHGARDGNVGRHAGAVGTLKLGGGGGDGGEAVFGALAPDLVVAGLREVAGGVVA